MSAVGRGQLVEQRAGVRHASRRGTRRTARWTGRSAGRRCAAPASRLLCCDRGGRTTRDRPKPLQRRRNQIAQRFGEHGEHADEVVGVSIRRPCRTRRNRSGRCGRSVRTSPRAGEAPWSAEWDRRRRPPTVGIDEAHRQACRRPPQQPVGDQRRKRAAGRREPAPRPASGPDRLRVEGSGVSMLTVARPSPLRRFGARHHGHAAQPERDALDTDPQRADQRSQWGDELQPQDSPLPARRLAAHGGHERRLVVAVQRDASRPARRPVGARTR